MANIPELAAGRISLFADTSTVGRSISKMFAGGDRQAAKSGDRWGALIGKNMSKSFDKTKPDMDKLADDVVKAEKRITAETERSAKAQALAKAKVEAAQANLNEKIEKYGKETAQAKRAAVQLMTAQNAAEKQTLQSKDALEKLNRELEDTKNAYKEGERASEAYVKGWKGLGRKLKDQVNNAFDKNLDQSKRAHNEGDTASDAYASGWTGLGTKLAVRTVAAVVIAGTAATAMAKIQGNLAGNAYVEGFGKGLGRLSGGRLLTDTLGDFGEWVGNLDKSSPKIALVSSAILTLSGAVIGATGNLLSLGGSILSIFPAFLALPGILASGGVAAGILVAAMSDVETQLAHTITRFTELGDQVSGAVWAEAAGPINNLSDALINNLTGALLGASTAMGSLVAAFAVEIQGSLPTGELASIVAYTEESLWNLHAAVAPVTESLMTLGTVGASYMPALSGWIVQLATDFNSWLQAAEADGRLKTWIDTGIQGMKDLGWVIYNTGAIFSTLTQSFRDAGFDATLGGLATSLENINTALSGPIGQGVLANVFGGARAALDGAYVGLSNLGDAFVAFAPTLERIMALGGQFIGTFLTHLATILENPVFMAGLESFFTGALAGIEALTPAMGPLGTMFGTLAETVGVFLENMGPVIGEILEKLAPVFTDLLIAIQPLIPILAETLLAAFEALLPIIESLVGWFGESFVPILEKMCGWIIKNADWLIPLVVVIGGLLLAIIPLIPAITTFATLLGALGIAAAPVIGWIALIVVGVIGLVAYIINLKAKWDWAWIMIQAKANQIIGWVVNTAFPWLSEKIAWLINKWENFKYKVAGVWNSIKAKIFEIFVWFANKVIEFRAKIQSLQDKFQSMKTGVGVIWDSLKNKLLTVYNTIKSNVLDKLGNAVKNGLPDAFRKAKNVIEDIWNGIKNVIKDPLRIVLRDILQNGLINKVNGILNAVDKKKTIPRVPSVWPIPGFRKGGYTGNKGKDEVAGVVHGRENVINAESSAAIERAAPGFLSTLNAKGAGALQELVGGEHGAAAGGPGGPGAGLWSGLQNSIFASGVAHLNGSIAGVSMDAVARAWNNMSNVRIKRGSGPNQITGRNGASLGNWGYAWTNGNFEVSPAVPAGMRQAVAIHEVGHTLGLAHTNSTASIMHPMMQGPAWPGAFDRATMRRVYGGAGKGNPPEGGGGFFQSIGNWLSEKISPIADFTKNIGGLFASKLPGGGLFADMGKAIVTNISGKIGDIIKEKIKGFFGGDDSGAGAKLPLYDNGGLLPTGKTLLENKTGKVERVLTNEQWRIQERNAELVEKHSIERGETKIYVQHPNLDEGYAIGNKIDNRLAFLANQR